MKARKAALAMILLGAAMTLPALARMPSQIRSIPLTACHCRARP